MGNFLENNNVELVGEIEKEFEFNHEVYSEKFYTTRLIVRRLSGVEDFIPIMVSERLIDVDETWTGKRIIVSGQFRSYNKYEDGKNHLMLSVFAREIEIVEEDDFQIDDKNLIVLDGYICKETTYRKTPLGREISDFLLAVNRSYGKSDYIPCICWGRDARFADTFDTGYHVKVVGRIQSREYKKKLVEDECETQICYEVSSSKVEKFEDELVEEPKEEVV